MGNQNLEKTVEDEGGKTVRCKDCGKKIPIETAYKTSKGKYFCDEKCFNIYDDSEIPQN